MENLDVELILKILIGIKTIIEIIKALRGDR